MTQETPTWAQLRDRVERFRGKLGPRWKGESEYLRRLHRGIDVLQSQLTLAGETHGWHAPAKGELADQLARSKNAS